MDAHQSSSYHEPLALVIISSISIGLGAIAALFIAVDIVLRRGWRSMMGVMQVTCSFLLHPTSHADHQPMFPGSQYTSSMPCTFGQSHSGHTSTMDNQRNQQQQTRSLLPHHRVTPTIPHLYRKRKVPKLEDTAAVIMKAHRDLYSLL